MRRQPVEADFQVEVSEDEITVRFWRTGSLYTFARFTTVREIAEFGPVSPDPVVRHVSRISGARNYDAAEVLAMAFRLAMAAAASALSSR
jgi:rhamnose utilization protein RhaD (predicted bifunctional aldolase and dehydrogenase)